MRKIFILGLLLCIVFCIPVVFLSTNEYLGPNLITIFVGYFCSILIFIKTKLILSRNTASERLINNLVFSNMITIVIYIVMLALLYQLFYKSAILVILGVFAYKISLIINVIKGGGSIE